MVTTLDIIVLARDGASGVIKQVEGASNGLSTTMKSTSSSLGSAGTAAESFGSKFKTVAKWIGSTIGAIGIEQFATKALESFDLLEQGEKRLALGLQRIGAGAQSLDTLTAWSKSFSISTGINQADIVAMQSKLVAMGGAFFKAAGPQANTLIENLTSGMVNLAAATGKSASMLMRSLGPSIINTPTAAIGLLQKYGVLTMQQVNDAKSLGATTGAQIGAMVKAGTITQAYGNYVRGLSLEQRKQAASTLEITALQGRYAGEAAKTATPLDRLRNLFNQLELAAGKFISAGLSWILNHGPAIISWAKTLAITFGPIVAIWGAYTLATKAAAAAQALFNLVMDANPIVLVGIAIAALAVIVIRNWSTIKAVTLAVWGSISSFFESVWAKMRAPVMAFVHFIGAALKPFIAAFRAEFKIAEDIVKITLKVIEGLFKVGWRIISDVVKLAWHVIVDVIKVAVAIIKPLFDPIAAAFRTAFQTILSVARTVWGAVKTVWGGVKSFFVAIFSGVADIVKGAFNLVIGAVNTVIRALDAIQIHISIFGAHFDWSGLGIPEIPTLAQGGVVQRTGLALVHEGEQFSGVGKGFRPTQIQIAIDRKRWVDESDYELTYRGFG